MGRRSYLSGRAVPECHSEDDFTFGDGWVVFNHVNALEGKLRYSDTPGAKATLKFVGTTVILVGVRMDNGAGKIEVKVDGKN